MKRLLLFSTLWCVPVLMSEAIDMRSVEREIERFEASHPAARNGQLQYILLLPPSESLQQAGKTAERGTSTANAAQTEFEVLERLVDLQSQRLEKMLAAERTLQRIQAIKKSPDFGKPKMQAPRIERASEALTVLRGLSVEDSRDVYREEIQLSEELFSPDLPKEEPSPSTSSRSYQRARQKQPRKFRAHRRPRSNGSQRSLKQEAEPQTVNPAPPAPMHPTGSSITGPQCGRVFSPPALESVEAPYKNATHMQTEPCSAKIR